MDLHRYSELYKRSIVSYDNLIKLFNKNELTKDLASLKQKTYEQNFWDNNKNAAFILRQIKLLEDEIDLWDNFVYCREEAEFYFDLLKEDDKITSDHIASLEKFNQMIEDIEINKTLSEASDKNDAILSIHPGAGGKESQDWAHMLYRLYTRWCERNGFKLNIIDWQEGDEAGIKDVTIEINGAFAYGKLKTEIGVHRLVRISPFDSQKRRHTSFASVFVFAEIDEDIENKKQKFKYEGRFV